MKKRIFIRIISLLLTIVILAGSQTSCENRLSSGLSETQRGVLNGEETVLAVETEQPEIEEIYDVGLYTVVYHANDLFGKCVALNLTDMIYQSANIQLPIVSDKAKETDREILIGETTRTASKLASACSLADDEFLLCRSQEKIVMIGKNYLCAGAAGKFVNQCLSFAVKGKVTVSSTQIKEISKAKPEKQVWSETKNVILMIGDGMGRNQVLKTIAEKDIDSWFADTFPGQAYCTTNSLSSGHTDSAAAATALATGFKTKNRRVGQSYFGTKLKNIVELANEKNRSTAILTTDVITGATPSGFLVHVSDRGNTDEIQKQIDQKISNNEVQFCEGSLGSGLFNRIREALKSISQDQDGYFAMIEEAYVDKGGHSNNFDTVTGAVKRLNDCVMYVAAFTMMHPDTALIVTADHETGGVTLKNGNYVFTSTDHTETDVPVYALGAGIGNLLKSKTIDNVDISKFIAKAHGVTSWGQ